jgi:hypothetical protein
MFDLWLNSRPDQLVSRHQQLLREAEQERLARRAGAWKMTPLQHLTLWAGNILIHSGMYLKRRCQTPREQIQQIQLPTMHFGSHVEY